MALRSPVQRLLGRPVFPLTPVTLRAAFDRAVARLDLRPRTSTVRHVTPKVSRAGRERDAAPPGVRAASGRWLGVTLLLAALLHLPAMPFDPLFLARILLRPPAAAPVEPPPAEEELFLPIDLDLLEGTPATTDSPAPTASDRPAEPGPAPGPAPEPTPATEDPAQDTPPKAAAPPTPGVKAPPDEDIYDDLDTPRRGTPTLQDPLTVAGGPGKYGVKNPFVQVLFNSNRLRGNSAGAALGGVLTALPEWKSFFDGTGIDPITDAEHLLIAGPQLRQSRDVVVWMEYRTSEKQMRAAIDALVKRTKGGKWIDDAPLPTALARAHGHRRVFALVPAKKLLVILPHALKTDLERVKRVRPFNHASRAGIVLSLATPRNAFAGYEGVIDVPKTFKWMRMVVTPLDDGAAEVALEIGDESAAAAAKDAPVLEKQLGQVRTLASIATLIGAEVLPPLKVEVDRDILRVKAKVSRKGLSHILNLARSHFASKPAPELSPSSGAKEEEEKGQPTPAASGSAAPAASGSAAPAASASDAPAAPSASATGPAGNPRRPPIGPFRGRRGGPAK